MNSQNKKSSIKILSTVWNKDFFSFVSSYGFILNANNAKKNVFSPGAHKCKDVRGFNIKTNTSLNRRSEKKIIIFQIEFRILNFLFGF